MGGRLKTSVEAKFPPRFRCPNRKSESQVINRSNLKSQTASEITTKIASECEEREVKIATLAHQNRAIAIASDIRVDGTKSPEIPQKEGVSRSEIATRNRKSLATLHRTPKSQCKVSEIASDFRGPRDGHCNRKSQKSLRFRCANYKIATEIAMLRIAAISNRCRVGFEMASDLGISAPRDEPSMQEIQSPQIGSHWLWISQVQKYAPQIYLKMMGPTA